MSSHMRMWPHDKKGSSGQRVKHWISSCLKTYMWKKRLFTSWPTAVCGDRYMQALQILTGFSGKWGWMLQKVVFQVTCSTIFLTKALAGKLLQLVFPKSLGWYCFPKQKEPSQLFGVIPSCSKVQKVAGKKWAYCISVDKVNLFVIKGLIVYTYFCCTELSPSCWYWIR